MSDPLRIAEAYGYLQGAVQNHLAKRDASSLAWLGESLAEADRIFAGRKQAKPDVTGGDQ